MSPSPAPAGFPRRRLLAGGAGLALLLAGCTSGGSGQAEQDTAAQEDALAAQVPVQEAVVAAYGAVVVADAAFGQSVADLAGQAQEQLDRLRAAAPGATAASSSAASSSAPSSSVPPGPPAGGDLRAWLRDQVSAASTAHAAACVGASGAGAALLGALAAGLRGHAAALA
ncbi:hypothetical protein JD79_02455 [Geodermatophilus normandii]|uniref:DUF4439 domain-containing protein n=1 Tax=Geodermatophilus normandii TaxID=1137989 RepID=A0A317QKN2_9ACTN|nr:hypothetical protein [Geodermatophilus normandii]PWW23286.1 hypothetical protein JD79_02455 [Geodermatophilus normandii]